MIELYSATACPFAQRTRALLTHLNIPFKLVEIDLTNRDPEFLKLTPTGKVPLFVEGQEKLYESHVINGYIAEKHGHDAAFNDDPYLRARERLAMAQWDQVIVPTFYRSLREPGSFDAEAKTKVSAELDELLRTTYPLGSPNGSLLSFHCAQFWARMDWLRMKSPIGEMVCERVQLRKWLDDATAQPPVQETLPDREATIARYS